MYCGEKILSLIPARGGSKGIKGKNIVPLSGKPLIAWTIEASVNSKYIDSTVITTDSRKIADIAENFGAEVPFLRPAELADDKAKTIDAVLHAINELAKQGRHYDVLVLLQPTSPLRTSGDIDSALENFFRAGGEESLASVSPVEDSPLLIRSLGLNGRLVPLLALNSTCRRQDMPKFYRVNGSIYINRIRDLSINTSFNDNPLPFVMEKSHSVDIDELKDIILAGYYMKESANK